MLSTVAHELWFVWLTSSICVYFCALPPVKQETPFTRFYRRSERRRRPQGGGLQKVESRWLENKTTPMPPLGTTVACSGEHCAGEWRWTTGANIFSHSTTFSFSTNNCTQSDSVGEHIQGGWVISNIQSLADLPPGRAFENGISFQFPHTLVTKETSKLIYFHTHTHAEFPKLPWQYV